MGKTVRRENRGEGKKPRTETRKGGRNSVRTELNQLKRR
jgi:hypothetical protein